MRILIRIIADLALLALAILAPWWLYAVAAILAIVFFPRFYEAFATSLVADLLFGAPGSGILHIPLSLTVATLIAYVVTGWVKAQIRYDAGSLG